MQHYSMMYQQNSEAARLARTELTSFLRQNGLPESIVSDIETAAGEALANAVEHGASAADRFIVDCTLNSTTCTVVVKDFGPGFEVEEIPILRSLDAARGFGLIIMRGVLDAVEYRDDGTRAILTKRIPPTAQHVHADAGAARPASRGAGAR